MYVFAPEVEGVDAEEVFEKARSLALKEMERLKARDYEIGSVTQTAPNKWRVVITIFE
jgi:hypothetical protein